MRDMWVRIQRFRCLVRKSVWCKRAVAQNGWRSLSIRLFTRAQKLASWAGRELERLEYSAHTTTVVRDAQRGNNCPE